MTSPLKATELGERLGYTSETVYAYARTGRLPQPIDPTLPARMWRWSVATVEQYEAGEWKRPTRSVA